MQLQLPKRVRPKDTYTFPYWNKDYQVTGQPPQMRMKYEATYAVVAQTMAAQELLNPTKRSYKRLNVMGLLATNFVTIPDFLAFRLKNMGHECQGVDGIVVVEKNKEVMDKVEIMHDELEHNHPPFSLWMVDTKLENIRKALEFQEKGRPVLARELVRECWDSLKSKINVFDYDLMCNWSKIDPINQLAAPTLLFGGETAVIHVNGIKHLERTHSYSSTDDEINEKVDKLADKLSKQYRVQFRSSVNTYQTKNRVKTTMGSVVLGITRKNTNG